MSDAFPLKAFCQVIRQITPNRAPAATLKDDASPVTAIDCVLETALRALILSHDPHDTIVGEEFPDHTGTTNITWILDPIDGTKAFVCGKPTFMTLLGRLENGTPTFGAAYQPWLDDLFWTNAGQTFYRRGQGDGMVLRTSAETVLGNARVSTTSPHLFGDANKAKFQALETFIDTQRQAGKGAGFVTYGGDAYQYALLAAGTVDLVVEDQLKPHDILPLIPLIQQAGGIVTTWTGAAITLDAFDGTVLAAANPRLHRACLQFLREC
ncbi:MAG: inositol monophosphatase family protein [bacterium]|jgi:myo-inositol-1(or 4)-monophosphatase